MVVTRCVCAPGLTWENRRMPKCVTEGGSDTEGCGEGENKLLWRATREALKEGRICGLAASILCHTQ